MWPWAIVSTDGARLPTVRVQRCFERIEEKIRPGASQPVSLSLRGWSIGV